MPASEKASGLVVLAVLANFLARPSWVSAVGLALGLGAALAVVVFENRRVGVVNRLEDVELGVASAASDLTGLRADLTAVREAHDETADGLKRLQNSAALLSPRR